VYFNPLLVIDRNAVLADHRIKLGPLDAKVCLKLEHRYATTSSMAGQGVGIVTMMWMRYRKLDSTPAIGRKRRPPPAQRRRRRLRTGSSLLRPHRATAERPAGLLLHSDKRPGNCGLESSSIPEFDIFHTYGRRQGRSCIHGASTCCGAFKSRQSARRRPPRESGWSGMHDPASAPYVPVMRSSSALFIPRWSSRNAACMMPRPLLLSHM
jgi:hypothetical protein